MDDVLDAGPRRRRRTGENFGTPLAARVARPRTSLLLITFAASNAPYKEQTARSQPAAAEGRQVSQPSAKTVARGYGARHKALRKRWAAEVARGEVCCARCGGVIWRDEPWDLDHTPDRSGYLGPSHRRCNRATATHRAKRKRRVSFAFVERRVSRPW